MRIVGSILVILGAAGCARAVRAQCGDDADGGFGVVTCSEPLCRTTSGRLCYPDVVTCDPRDSQPICEPLAGIADTELDVVCIEGDYDREMHRRTTPRCFELLTTDP